MNPSQLLNNSFDPIELSSWYTQHFLPKSVKHSTPTGDVIQYIPGKYLMLKIDIFCKAKEAVEIFRISGLDKSILKLIWDLADVHEEFQVPGLLWSDFATGMTLVCSLLSSGKSLYGMQSSLETGSEWKDVRREFDEMVNQIAQNQDIGSSISSLDRPKDTSIDTRKFLDLKTQLLELHQERIGQGPWKKLIELLSIEPPKDLHSRLSSLKLQIQQDMKRLQQEIPKEDVQAKASRIVQERMKRLGLSLDTLPTNDSPIDSSKYEAALECGKLLLTRLESLEKRLPKVRKQEDEKYLERHDLLGPLETGIPEFDSWSSEISSSFSSSKSPQKVVSVQKVVSPPSKQPSPKPMSPAPKPISPPPAKPISPPPQKPISPPPQKPISPPPAKPISPPPQKPISPPPQKPPSPVDSWLNSPVHELIRTPSVNSTKQVIPSPSIPSPIPSPTPSPTPSSPMDSDQEEDEVMVLKDYPQEGLKQGDLVIVKEITTDWIYCHFNSKEAWIPRIHLDIPMEVLAHGIVIEDYIPQRDDEIEIKKGDYVEIFIDDDWSLVKIIKGINVGKKGIVPGSFLQKISEKEWFDEIQTSKDPFDDSNVSVVVKQLSTLNQFDEISPLNMKFNVEMDDKARKRQEGIFEFIETEKSYLADIQRVVEMFLIPLEKLIGRKKVDEIVGNWDEILKVNTELLSDLLILENDEIVSEISPTLEQHVNILGQVYEKYCRNQIRGALLLMELSKDVKVKEVCGQGLDLSSYLLKPMQRITRYPLLIRQILHYTDSSHGDCQGLQRLLKQFEGILKKINDEIKFQECRSKMSKIRELVDYQVDPFPGNSKRWFVYEGELQKAKSGRLLKAYLFSDILLLTDLKSNLARSRSDAKPYWIYRKPIILKGSIIQDSPSWGEDAFQIVKNNETLIVKSDHKRTWIHHLTNLIKEEVQGYDNVDLIRIKIISVQGIPIESSIHVIAKSGGVKISTRQVEKFEGEWKLNQTLLIGITGELKLIFMSGDEYLGVVELNGMECKGEVRRQIYGSGGEVRVSFDGM